MTYFPDLAPCGYFALDRDVEKLRAVGWLDAYQQFVTGPLDQDLVRRLFVLTEDAWEPCHFWGFHACELCRGPRFGTEVVYEGRRLTVGARNVFVPGSGLVYVTPSLVLHYILNHQYQPPQAFVDAVRSCPGMRTKEYLDAVRHNGPAWLGDSMADV